MAQLDDETELSHIASTEATQLTHRSCVIHAIAELNLFAIDFGRIEQPVRIDE